MTEIIPAILVKDFRELRESILLYSNLTSLVQIDICDGNFVPFVSWPMHSSDERSVTNILNGEEGLPCWNKLDFEFDLMVKNAHEQFEFFIQLGAKRIIFHIEAENDPKKFKEFLEGLDMYTRENTQIGIALNTTTSIEKIKPLISLVDFVQCMGIEEIGSQSQPFDERVLDQISLLRKEYPEIIISVDGSVNENTAPALVKAGANRLVVGSALIRSYDIKETIKNFENL